MNGLPAAVKYPTPTASEAGTSEKTLDKAANGELQMSLGRAVKLKDRPNWPTPTVGDTSAGESRLNGDFARYRGIDLATAVVLFPTPRAGDGGGQSFNATKERIIDGGDVMLSSLVKHGPKIAGGMKTYPTPNAATHLEKLKPADPTKTSLIQQIKHAEGGQLNPKWVEWLMGWPIGWTSLDPIADTAWYEWLTSGGAWLYDPAELNPDSPGYISRITKNKTNRIPRLAALGNGWVPQVPFNILQVLVATDGKGAQG